MAGTETVRTYSVEERISIVSHNPVHSLPVEQSVLDREAEAPSSMRGHCGQRNKLTILWCVAISPVSLQTCTLPTEIHSVPGEKGPVPILPAGCEVWYRGGILSLLFTS